MNIKTFLIYITAMISLLGSPSSHSNDLIITKSFTGGWFDPAKDGQGFLLEIIRSNNQKKALTTWFTYDQNGQQLWLIGVGDIVDQTITFNMIMPNGGLFGDAHDPNQVTQTSWGTVTFNFNDCNQGTASWNPVISGFNAGSMPIVRNTAINNLNCTGGLFDELGDTLSSTGSTITALNNTGADPDASGKTKYEVEADRIDYSVEIEDLPVGAYELFVGGTLRGEINVIEISPGITEGEIEFRDPVEPGKLPLDFDPTGQTVDVSQGAVIYLTTDGSTGGGQGGSGGQTSPNAPPFGDAETEVFLTNTGVFPLGQAKAELEQRPDRVDFDIELEDVPVGFYDFSVDGDIKGVIEVVQTAAGIEGELEYRNPVEAGKLLLDFNPIDRLLEISQGSQIMFSGVFTLNAGGGNNGDGDDDDGDGSGGSGGSGGGGGQNVELEVPFTNTGLDPDASGEVEYEVRSDRTDFKVKVEDLTFGQYQLFVGGVSVADLNVNMAEVELEFRDPVEPGKLPLNFDPLNQVIEIRQGSDVYLTATLQ